ncbi:MAG TPA: 30S ribosome-binding factor RbfA [Rhodospirillales bacterium]|nr:30S ribosome-binding factor RbfA [Rhodospirillales bacterium]
MSRDEQPSGQRQLRVGEELRHTLAWVLERGELRDPALAASPVTVTEVRISPDLRQATVYVMPLGGEAQDTIIAALTRARGFLRRRIAGSVHLKFVPDLTFQIDRSFEEADRIARALRQARVARDLDDEPEHREDGMGDEDERRG